VEVLGTLHSSVAFRTEDERGSLTVLKERKLRRGRDECCKSRMGDGRLV